MLPENCERREQVAEPEGRGYGVPSGYREGPVHPLFGSHCRSALSMDCRDFANDCSSRAGMRLPLGQLESYLRQFPCQHSCGNQSDWGTVPLGTPRPVTRTPGPESGPLDPSGVLPCPHLTAHTPAPAPMARSPSRLHRSRRIAAIIRRRPPPPPSPRPVPTLDATSGPPLPSSPTPNRRARSPHPHL